MEFGDLKYIVKSFVGDKSTYKYAKKENYYFNHIPKTGGTTVRYMLYDYFGGDNIYPNAFEYFIKNRGSYLIWDEFITKADKVISTTLLMGHYDIKPIDLYPIKPKVFSIFRDPVNCVISSIRYNMKRGRRYSDMSFDEVLESELWREGSMQAKHMGYKRKEPNLDEVLRNVDNLDCIGIAEQFDRSISLLNRQFDWELIVTGSKNISKNKMRISESQVKKIRQAADIDIEVYNYALASFNKRCKYFAL